MLDIPERMRGYIRVRAGPVMQSWHRLPLTDGPNLLGSRPVLVIAPHPDDESLGCGGLIADCQARGQSVHVLVLTDGAASHPKSRMYPPPRLAALRAEEARAAVAALGLPTDRIGFIGIPDGKAPLRGKRLREAANRIADYACSHSIGTICTTWPGDPHPDHVAAYRAAARAVRDIGGRLLCYPVWGWTLPADAWVPATSRRGGRLDISAHIEAKLCAIACHRSQTTDLINDDPSAFRISPEFLANFARPFEVFIEAGGWTQP